MALEKMEIVAYTDDQYSSQTSSCTVNINPSSYSHKHKVNYNNSAPQGAANTTLKFKSISPETVSFDINFDGTGAIEGTTQSVSDQIKTFKDVCFTYNGEIHEPNYLILSWGDLVFKCKLTSFDVNYTLFKQDGTPLRAKSSVSYEQALDVKTISKGATNESPDLTHKIEVKQGDTLPNICFKIYGDCRYYLEVAKFNQITNFRQLVPGSTLYLPPLK